MKGGMLMGCHHGMSLEMLSHIKENFTEFAGKF
jgi:hypothetical protein